MPIEITESRCFRAFSRQLASRLVQRRASSTPTPTGSTEAADLRRRSRARSAVRRVVDARSVQATLGRIVPVEAFTCARTATDGGEAATPGVGDVEVPGADAESQGLLEVAFDSIAVWATGTSDVGHRRESQRSSSRSSVATQLAVRVAQSEPRSPGQAAPLIG
jgi:hypothetical protein